jgi:hypothetical protein
MHLKGTHSIEIQPIEERTGTGFTEINGKIEFDGFERTARLNTNGSPEGANQDVKLRLREIIEHWKSPALMPFSTALS